MVSHILVEIPSPHYLLFEIIITTIKNSVCNYLTKHKHKSKQNQLIDIISTMQFSSPLLLSLVLLVCSNPFFLLYFFIGKFNFLKIWGVFHLSINFIFYYFLFFFYKRFIFWLGKNIKLKYNFLSIFPNLN